MAMLSFFTGWIAMRVFGDQVITLRLLAMACYLVAILMPVLYFYRRTGNRLWSVYLFAVVTVVVQCTHIYFYGWDAGAYPYESAMLTLSMCYIDSPSRRKEVLTGCLLGALGMVRVPALVLAGPAAVLVAVAAGRRHGRPASKVWRAGGPGFVSLAAPALLLMNEQNFGSTTPDMVKSILLAAVALPLALFTKIHPILIIIASGLIGWLIF